MWKDGQLITFLFEANGDYRIDVFDENSKLVSTSFTKKDVTSHFRNIEFGNYSSILPHSE
ncbi:hypothetical protein C1X05_02760 [Laceyella sacchari]|nr:hypothetical protein C1X05_02760 [Laceyella sacchari]